MAATLDPPSKAAGVHIAVRSNASALAAVSLFLISVATEAYALGGQPLQDHRAHLTTARPLRYARKHAQTSVHCSHLIKSLHSSAMLYVGLSLARSA